ncbi:MAG TPA: FtsX-like permease family protein [Polyangiaceae bacterium]|nr:FtsX-like permease family protein [Polyangiaceae bacterium]
MGFPVTLALRYMRSKKQASVSVGTLFAILGVALGVAALATVISVTGGFRAEFREKVLGVNAHVLVLKYSSDFHEYRTVMDTVEKVPGVIGVAPFVINPMMVTHGDRTATGVLLKGIDPERASKVLDLPRHIIAGSMNGLRLPGAKPPERRRSSMLDDAASTPTAYPLGPDTPAKPDATKKEKSGGLLADLRKLVEDEALEKDAGAPAPSDAAGDEAEETKHEATGVEPGLAPGAPVGKIEPSGGFSVPLPDDDVLPADIDPDPCRSPEAIKKLPGIIIGATLARNLGAKLDDCLQVTSPTIGFVYARGAMHAPVAKQFRVTAIFDAGFDQYDSKLVYTDLYESQAFYDSGDSVTGVEMKVADIDRAREVRDRVEEALANGVYHTLDWEELNHGLFTALRIQQILMSLVLALIIVVAAFTVIATLIMVVLDKKREIAVLKAMGARNNALLRAFLYQGGFIGLAGTAAGLVLGYVICKLLTVYGLPLDPKVYFISKLPVLMRVSDFAWVGVFAVLVCLIATVWPAQYAARLRPAEAFRENR